MQDHTRTPSRALRRIATLGATALAAIGLTLGAASPALAHDELTGQSFTADADGTTTGIVLSFSNNIMEVGTEILIEDPDLTDVTEGAPQISGRNVTQAITGPLPKGGAYRVTWRVVSSDGHPIQGIYFFEIAENGSAEITATGETDPRFAETAEGSEPEPHHAAESTSEAPAETNERGDSSFPAGGWIALAAVLALGIGAGLFLAWRKRKKSAVSGTEGAN